MNTINWKPKALKQLRKIPATDGAIIRQCVNSELVDLSAARNVKALTNHQYTYRLRVGRYRVFFDVHSGDITIVTIEEVKKRDDRTY
jgi:mRNA interferase RelE/StbE